MDCVPKSVFKSCANSKNTFSVPDSFFDDSDSESTSSAPDSFLDDLDQKIIDCVDCVPCVRVDRAIMERACIRAEDLDLNHVPSSQLVLDESTVQCMGSMGAKRHCTMVDGLPSGSGIQGGLSLHSNHNCTINININN